MLDWQTILVALIILAATLYVARRAFNRLISLRANRRSSSACEAGCGCSAGDKQAGRDGKSLVEIGRAR